MQQHGTTKCAQGSRAEQIAHLNDKLRKTGRGGTVVVTQGVMSLTGFDAPRSPLRLRFTKGSTPTTIHMVNAISVICRCSVPICCGRSTITTPTSSSVRTIRPTPA